MLTCAALAIGISLGSYHLDRDYPFNETNPGIHTTCDGWTGGIFRNSFSRWSLHAGKIIKWGPVDIEVGIATGYDKRTWREPYSPENANLGCTPGHQWCERTEGVARIIPIVIPSVRVANARVALVPPMGGKHKGALTFGYEW